MINATISEDRMANLNQMAGQYWFSKGTMSFFGTKIESDGMHMKNVDMFLFISSDKPPNHKRVFCIRSFNPNTSGVLPVTGVDVGLTKSQATKLFNKLLLNIDTVEELNLFKTHVREVTRLNLGIGVSSEQWKKILQFLS